LKRHNPGSKFTELDIGRLGRVSKKTAEFHNFRRTPHEQFFLGSVPELQDSIRISEEASAEPPPPDGDGARLTLGELRLQVLRSLPPRHEQYLIKEIRKWCSAYLHANPVAAREISPGQLVSEIWLRLIGAVVLPNEEEMFDFPTRESWSTDPEHDGRVEWLIQQIGGRQALGHRCEDIRREQWGRALSEGGRRAVQPDDDNEVFETGEDPLVDQPLQEADARRAWSGLVIAFSREFGQEEDASKLVRLLAQSPEVFEGSCAGRWPVSEIVHLLNKRFPPPTWTDRRVEDAKKRLVSWVKRFKRKNGLDQIDVEAFFARLARQQPPVSAPSRRSPVGFLAKFSLGSSKCSRDK
jgi:hypothetical protein